MQLYAICNHCKGEASIKSNAVTRLELEKDKGEVFNVQCTSCHKNMKKHVNDIKAKNNRTFMIASFFITIIACIALWHYFGFFILLIALIPIGMVRQQDLMTRAFNGYAISRTK